MRAVRRVLPWLTVGYSTGRLYGTVPAIYSATVPLPTVTITVSSARLFDGRWCQGRAKPRDRQYNASNPSHPNSPPTHSLSGTQTARPRPRPRLWSLSPTSPSRIVSYVSQLPPSQPLLGPFWLCDGKSIGDLTSYPTVGVFACVTAPGR